MFPTRFARASAFGFACVCAGVVSVIPARSSAQSTEASRAAPEPRSYVDGVYGRLRGDVTVSLEASAGLLLARDGPRVGFAAIARMRALDTAGFFVGYERALTGSQSDAVSLSRWDVISLGVDLRPLMLARIFQDWERGPQWVDLFVDSIGFDLGAGWVRPGDSWRAGSGLAWIFGGGFELPMWWSQGAGLMLRFATRWVHSADWDAVGPGAGAASGDAVSFTLGLVVRAVGRVGLMGTRGSPAVRPM